VENRFSRLQPPLILSGDAPTTLGAGVQPKLLRSKSNVAVGVEKALKNAASPATVAIVRIPSKWGFADPFATSVHETVPVKESKSGDV
jgi:hypothetical protein